MHACMYVCVCVRVCARTHVRTYVCMYVCMYPFAIALGTSFIIQFWKKITYTSIWYDNTLNKSRLYLYGLILILFHINVWYDNILDKF